MNLLRELGRQSFRVGAVRKLALAVGAARGYSLVLVFHRLGDRMPRRGLLVSVPEDLFRQQIEALLEIGRIVPLECLLDARFDGPRPRFAITFDDDSVSHYERALPILREFGVPATFFLSGRALHGLGSLWFERLDALISARGVPASGRSLGIATDDAEELARACEKDVQLQQRIEELPGGVQHLSGAEIRALADAGMTIGFHTLDHCLLPRLPDSALDEALTRGRRELERAAGQPVRLFAYPHGKTDDRIADHVRRRGFVAAFTGRPLAFRAGDDPFRIGRWEPGAIGRDRLMIGIAAKLSGAARRG